MDVIPTIRTASRDFYLAYMNTPEWRRVRNRKLRTVGYQCERCGSKRDLQVHHKTYERLGNERDDDLEVLCANDHEAEHLEQMAQSDSGIYLKIAREALKADPFRDIADLSEDAKMLCAKHRVRYDGPEIHRAIGLLTSTGIKRQTPQRRVDGTEPPPQTITTQEAVEFLARVFDDPAPSRLIKVIPSMTKTPIEQRAHEAGLQAGIKAEQQRAYVAERAQARRPMRDRLEDIFAGRL